MNDASTLVFKKRDLTDGELLVIMPLLDTDSDELSDEEQFSIDFI